MNQLTLIDYNIDIELSKTTELLIEESMRSKYIHGKIQCKQYQDWLAQKKGLKDNKEYLDLWAQKKGYSDLADYKKKKGFNKYNKKDNPKNVLKYQHTPKGYFVLKKHKLKRYKELGYNVINPDKIMEDDFVGHHLNKEFVIYIPKQLHYSAYNHSVVNDKNMSIINEKAIDWYFQNYELLCYLQE